RLPSGEETKRVAVRLGPTVAPPHRARQRCQDSGSSTRWSGGETVGIGLEVPGGVFQGAGGAVLLLRPVLHLHGREGEVDRFGRRVAASAAARAGCGRGEDCRGLDDQEQARWRRQALLWLRQDLALLQKGRRAAAAKDRHLAREFLKIFRREPALAGVRDP